MLDGFLIAHRDLLDSPMFGEPDLFRFWFYLRARANYQPGRWRGIDMKVGDVVSSHRLLADQMGVSTGTIGRWLTKLQKYGEVSINAGRDFSIINVIRTDAYEVGKQDEWDANRDANKDADSDAREGAIVDADKGASRDKSNKAIKQSSNQEKKSPLPPKGEPTEPKAMDCPSLEEFPEAVRNETCKAAWGLWLAYKRKIRQPYKTARGNRDQLTAAAQDGPRAFCGCLRNAQRHEWKGPNLRAYRDMLAKGEITPDGEAALAPSRSSPFPNRREIVNMAELEFESK